MDALTKSKTNLSNLYLIPRFVSSSQQKYREEIPDFLVYIFVMYSSITLLWHNVVKIETV